MQHDANRVKELDRPLPVVLGKRMSFAERQPTLTELYDHLTERGPLGLRTIAAELYYDNVIAANDDISELCARGLVRQMVQEYRLATGASPRMWEVVDPK